MADLQTRKQKIQEKRKQTDWRDFVKEIASRQPNVFYKYDNLVSRFPKTDRINGVTKYDDFYENNTPIFAEGLEYNHTLGFFENLSDFWGEVLMPNMVNFFHSENCEYGDVVSKSKNVYLSTYVVNGDENVTYCFGVKDECSNIINSCIISDHSENIYQSLGINKSYGIFYSKYIVNSSGIWFSSNLLGCQNCILCNDLENKSYCIQNKQYSPDEYEERKKKILSKKGRFQEFYASVKAPSNNVASSNVTGNFLVETENVQQGFYTYRIKNGRNIINVGGFEGNTNIYDVVDGGGPSLHDIYAVNGIAINSSNCYLSCHVPNCTEVFYSYCIESCSYCFGCVGLKNKQYCILNKQYTKDERHEKVDKILEKMDNEGTIGDFFPSSFNPFYFNDTVASLIEDFDQNEIVDGGYLRRDEKIKVDIPEGVEVVKTSDLGQYEGWMHEGEFISISKLTPSPSEAVGRGLGGGFEGERTIHPDILKKVIQDEQGNYYRIIPMEYKFLKKHGLPLPRRHWLERLKQNFKIS